MSARDLLKPGQRFLCFTVKRLVGRGGMGAVYEVIAGGGRRYALKVLQPTWQDRDEQVQRMLDEGTIMVGIKHPNIVEVHDHGVHKDLVWMLMELVEGETLRARIRRERSLSVDAACFLLRAAGYAAEQCHVLGIIHRDIKPENFMITPDQRLKMLDLGIAHIHCSTLTQEPIGTPAYMAPEQFNTRLGVSPATDVYGLGLLGYEMLVGWNPFLRDDTGRARNAWELCYEHAFTMPPPLEDLGVPAPIAAVITEAIAKDPRARHPSGAAFADAIWTAWKQVREGAGDGDGDGSLASMSASMLFRTGPAGPLSAAARAPVVSAPSQRLPGPMADPAAVQAYLTRRREEAAAAAAAPHEPEEEPLSGGTVRLSLAERDPSCVAADRGDEGRRPGRGRTMRLPIAERDPSCVEAERPRAEPRGPGISERVMRSRLSRSRRRAAMKALPLALAGAALAAGLSLMLRERDAAPAGSPPPVAPAEIRVTAEPAESAASPVAPAMAEQPAPEGAALPASAAPPSSAAPWPASEAAPLVNPWPAPAATPKRVPWPVTPPPTSSRPSAAPGASRSIFRGHPIFVDPSSPSRATPPPERRR